MFILKAGILASVFIGCIKTARLAWDLGDLGVGLMAWLNIAAILILHKPALKAFKDYERQMKEGKDLEFDPKSLDIKNADFWEQKLQKSTVKDV